MRNVTEIGTLWQFIKFNPLNMAELEKNDSSSPSLRRILTFHCLCCSPPPSQTSMISLSNTAMTLSFSHSAKCSNMEWKVNDYFLVHPSTAQGICRKYGCCTPSFQQHLAFATIFAIKLSLQICFSLNQFWSVAFPTSFSTIKPRTKFRHYQVSCLS